MICQTGQIFLSRAKTAGPYGSARQWPASEAATLRDGHLFLAEHRLLQKAARGGAVPGYQEDNAAAQRCGGT